MNYNAYNNIAAWYDNYLKENPLYQEVVLPALFKLTGDIQGQTICDLGCGQGWITRALARRGAQMTGVDLADQLLALADRHEAQEPLGVKYLQGDVQSDDLLPGCVFDGCVCTWSLVDIPDLSATFSTMRRLLTPGGWLVFVITHPCFEAPHAQWISMDGGGVARVVMGYFHEGFWTSEAGGVRSRVGAYHRTLSTYLNTLVAAGFVLEQMLEPAATGERGRLVAGNLEVPSLLFIRARASI
ncbi:MAG TPA: class I SAM-dependent methyltransferase [Ktedonobacteraceae bacterium]|nr:class I SAM-dependent methyltransferase [Ktedonobacteraceae bacterium]